MKKYNIQNYIRYKEDVKKFEMQKKFVCPQCGKTAVKKKGYALWECSKCGTKFAGGSYAPQTESGRTAARLITSSGKLIDEKESD